MNAKCPNCNHHFRFGERKRLVTWRFTRRAVPCPGCSAVLMWKRKALIVALTGILLTAIFDGIALGCLLAPQIGLLFGFIGPQVAHDPYWESWPVRSTEIAALALALVASLMMFVGIFKLRLVRAPAMG